MKLRPRWLLGSALALALALWAAGLLDVAPPSPGNCTCSTPEPVYPFGPSSASVPDCCCAFGDLERSNAESVHPLLQRVVATPFFSHYAISLCSECELWQDDPLCVLRNCSVCPCGEEGGGPEPDWAVTGADAPWRVTGSAACSQQEDTPLDISVAAEVRVGLGAAEQGAAVVPETGAVVVNLALNPERHTGYGGASAARVWSAIHGENCFSPAGRSGGGGGSNGGGSSNGGSSNGGSSNGGGSGGGGSSGGGGGGGGGDDELCLLPAEQRVYNRVLSGLHSSISLHIARTYSADTHRPAASLQSFFSHPGVSLLQVLPAARDRRRVPAVGRQPLPRA